MGAAIVCGLFAAAFTALPNIATWAFMGDARMPTEFDEVVYRALTRDLFDGSNRLMDPWHDRAEERPQLYAWASLVPGIVVLRTLGLEQADYYWISRIVWGFAFGVGLFALCRSILGGRPWWAAVACCLVVADVGSNSLPVVGTLTKAAACIQGIPDIRVDGCHYVLRFPTPLQFYWVLPVFLITHSYAHRNRWAFIACVLLLTFTVYVYFFLWTALAVFLVISAILTLVSWRKSSAENPSRNRALASAGVLVGGLLLAAPSIVASAQTAANPANREALDRMAKGLHLSAGSPVRANYLANKSGLLVVGAAVVGAWIFRNRVAESVAVMSGCGYILMNTAFFTGLEFENWHWSSLVNPMGAVVVQCLVAAAVARFAAYRAVLAGYVVVALLIIGGGGYVRYVASTLSPEATRQRDRTTELLPLADSLTHLGPDTVLAGPEITNIAFLYGHGGQLYQHHYIAFDRC